MHEPTIDDVRKAYQLICSAIHRTPTLTCDTLDSLAGSEIFFKCENFQRTGSFKIRGATNAVFSLPPQSASYGVATHSSGNHAAALALAARMRGIKAFVVMPKNAPRVKRDAVSSYGAEIYFCEPTMEDRERTLAQVVLQTGAAIVHPYNDYRVMAGQGTAALELCETIRDLDVVMTPVGGGGLLSGTAVVVSSVSPGTKIIGTEPEAADDTARSFHAGNIIPAHYPATIADGLRTTVGSLTFPVIKRLVSDILTVSEQAVVAALRLIWERMKIVVEPSSAVPVAALLSHRGAISGKKIGIILSGGNVDMSSLLPLFAEDVKH